MLLAAIIFVLFAGGIVAWLSEAWGDRWPKWTSLVTIAVASLLLLPCIGAAPAIEVSLAGTPSNWIVSESIAWIPRFGINFIFALDGLSLLMVALTLFLGIVAVASSWREIDYRPGFFQFNILWTLAGVVGVFVALDLFLFFFFWEVMLIPMYFLIAIWGHENRAYAAMKFFLFTQISGLVMLLAIVALVFVNYQATSVITFSYFDLLAADVAPGIAFYLMLGFFIAFVVKLPGVPFHTWLPDAHTQAPTAASVLLAGILLKSRRIWPDPFYGTALSGSGGRSGACGDDPRRGRCRVWRAARVRPDRF
ncbi:MAG: proton-conducting transporter membrane subunit [Gammaproteobacteria bacterium]|nr:proton-conducting transporter membrane subunit [Gammaproteobacteria bacterium]